MNRSNALKIEQFNDLQNYIHTTIKQIAKEILNGNIDLKPYYSGKSKETPCQYCKYHGICQFDTACSGNEYKYIPNEDKETVIEKLKKHRNLQIM